jgi:hypothetical protein
MGRLTICAKDSAEAMKLIKRELGDDAFILSTEKDGEMIEITATDSEEEAVEYARSLLKPELPPEEEKTPPAKSLVPSVAEVTKGLTIFSRASRINIDVDDSLDLDPTPVAVEPDPISDALREELAHPRIKSFRSESDVSKEDERGWDEDMPRVAMGNDLLEASDEDEDEDILLDEEPLNSTPAFAEVLHLEIEKRPAREKPPEPRMMRARHVVFVGPAGAGKSMAALQLAVLRQDKSDAPVPKFVFAGSDSRSDGAFLAQKARLFGVECTFSGASALPEVDEGQVQMTVVSGRGADTDLPPRADWLPEDACVVLVLPTGLRASKMAQILAPWSEHVTDVILTADAFEEIEAEEVADLTALGLRLAMISRRHRMVGGFERVDRPSRRGAQPGRRVMSKGGQA